MNRLKVMTVVGTRPEIIRLSELIRLIDDQAEQILIHTQQNSSTSLSDVFFSDFRLRPPDVLVASDTGSFASFCATTFPAIERAVLEHAPDVFLVLGDTNSALSALVAKKLGVPVFHLEAGNRSFDSNVPEELNRLVVDQIADFNFVYSEFARQNLLNEGHSQRYVFKSGSPMAEVLKSNKLQIATSRVLLELGLGPKSYLLVSLHRQENIDEPERLVNALREIEATRAATGKKLVLSAHPRLVDKASSVLAEFENWIVAEPFGFADYSNLQLNAYCVISDSGSVSEEAAVLGFPAVTLRDSMERQEALEMGVLPMVGLGKGVLLAAVQGCAVSPRPPIPFDYEGDDFSRRVWSVISSVAPLSHDWLGKRRRNYLSK